MPIRSTRPLTARGIVIAAGEDSTGFLARCVRWFATKAPHDTGDIPPYNWRCGCARSVGGLGFSLLYYEATPAFHTFLKHEPLGFAEFKRGELDKNTTRYVSLKNADHLLFELLDAPKVVRPLHHYYCSFSHYPDTGFLGRLCRELSALRIVVVQHDAIMVRADSPTALGELDHAMRCYVSVLSGLQGIERFKAAMRTCLTKASNGAPPKHLNIHPPDPGRGIVTGDLPVECKRDGQPIACLFLLGDVRDRSVGAIDAGNGPLPETLEWAVARSLGATRLLGECADVAETMRDVAFREACDESRPIIRLSMRKIGGWAFVAVCVPVRDRQEAESLGVVLKRRLALRRILDYEQIRLCGSQICPQLPWATAGARKALPRLAHVDRPGFLADYFANVGDLTDRVSVIQYDAWVEAITHREGRGASATHRLCVSPTVPDLKDAERAALLRAWENRHSAWAVSANRQ